MSQYTLNAVVGAKKSRAVPILNPLVCDKLNNCLKKSVRYCIRSQKRNGAWMVVPEPRVFETALIGYALSRSLDEDCIGAVDRAKKWLQQAAYQKHSPIALLIERAVASIFIGRQDEIDLTAKALTAPEYKSRMMLLYTLALYAGVPVKAVIGEEMLCSAVSKRFNFADQTKMKQWTRIEVASVSLMLKARYHLDTDTDQALKLISDAQDKDGGFFQNPVATALAYIALCEAAGDSPERLKCKRYLLDRQQPDGTWRFCTSDVWDTVLTIRSFHGHPLFDKIALSRGVGFLLNAQNDDSGWAFSSSVESDNDTTSAAILALKDASIAKESCLRALEFLSDYQQPDGLWRTWRFTEDPPVEDVNAHVLSALTATKGWHSIDDGAVKAWLARRFDDNGRWSASWYYGAPYAIAEVSEGLGVLNSHVDEALLTLKHAQNPDGGWGAEAGQRSLPSATGLALTALMRRPSILSNANIEKALRYLIDTQKADGRWHGVPEMYGPRPLLSHYQTHTQAFVTKGLLAVWQKLRNIEALP